MNIYNKYKSKMFFAPDLGGGESGTGDGADTGGGVTHGTEVFQPPTKVTTGDRPLPPNKPAKPAPGLGTESAPTGGEPAAPERKEFDPEKFAKEFATSFGDSIKPALESRKEAPAMTQEEARKLLKTWEPDDAWYAKYDNLDTRKAAVQEMRDALVTQADTLAQMRMMKMVEDLRGEISPQLRQVQQFADQQRDDRFLKTFPQLGEPKLRPLVMAVAEDLAKQGKKFNGESDAFKALAEGVEAVLQVNNPEFKLTPAGSSPEGKQTENGRNPNAIPVTSPGAGGGSGRRATTETAKPRGIAVFSK